MINPAEARMLSLGQALAWLAGLLMLPGCIGYDYERHGSRGIALSEAMESSASGGAEPLQGAGSTESHYSLHLEPDAAFIATGAGPDGGAMVSYDQRDYGWQLPVDVAYAVPFNGDIEGITRFTITPLAGEDERNFGGIFLSGGIVDLKPGSLPDRGVKNPWWLESGLVYRRYLNGPHTFLSPYLTANISYQLLFWDYRNPVVTEGDTIRSDGLQGVGGYAGIGVATRRNSRLSFYGEAGFGGTVFVEDTFEGFCNDVFDNFGYFSVKAGLSLKF